jgi:hypothetical protein
LFDGTGGGRKRRNLTQWPIWFGPLQRKIVVEAENMFERTLVRCVRNHFRTWHETATWQLEDRQRRWEEGGVALVARIERRAYVAEPLREWRRVTAQLARGRMVADEKWHEMCLDIKIEWFDRWIANAKQQVRCSRPSHGPLPAPITDCLTTQRAALLPWRED